MELRYPGISSGYIGEKNNNQTLNSKFYSLLHKNFENIAVQNDDGVILIPQRIPRSGLFDELYKLETSRYQNAFTLRRQELEKSFKCSVAQLNENQDKRAIRLYINWANICLRYGRFQMVLDATPVQTAIHSFVLEIHLLKELARIELQLSSGLPVSGDNYLLLAEKYLSEDSVSEREKIMLLNQLIVTIYRHQKGHRSKKIFLLARNHLTRLEKFEENNPLNQLCCSIGYRGLAMVSEFGPQLQTEILNRAENIALNMKGRCISENIIFLENQYTCYQSIAKWHLHNHDDEKTENFLNKMTEVDPNDSTAYSELGLHNIQMKKYDNAAAHFKKALERGPPGVSMNTYYYAKCIEILGHSVDGIKYLHESAELDDTAVSPWLDLFERYQKNNDAVNASKSAKHILSTPILRTQLETNEILNLQNYIN